MSFAAGGQGTAHKQVSSAPDQVHEQGIILKPSHHFTRKLQVLAAASSFSPAASFGCRKRS